MNGMDIFVIAVIAISALIGYYKGLLKSVFKVVSFFVAVFGAIKFSPLLTNYILETRIYTMLKSGILERLLLQRQDSELILDESVKSTLADNTIQQLSIPEFLKEKLIENIPNASSLIDTTQIFDAISGELAYLLIRVASVIVLYFALRILLLILQHVLDLFSKLPVVKQMNEIGGLIFGIIQGTLSIYIIFAIMTIFYSLEKFNWIAISIDNSLIAKYLFYNNIVANWILRR